jgi:hypothetical protein
MTALLALALTGCAATASTGHPEVSLSAGPTGPGSVSLSAGEHPQAPGGSSPATLGVGWNEASKTAALEVATTAMTLYARPGVSAQAWITDLRPLLTPEAAQDYTDVDPSTIGITSFGAGELVVDETNGYAAMVRFGSPAGAYEVVLHRDGAGQPWKVVRFKVPGAE